MKEKKQNSRNLKFRRKQNSLVNTDNVNYVSWYNEILLEHSCQDQKTTRLARKHAYDILYGYCDIAKRSQYQTIQEDLIVGNNTSMLYTQV